MTTSKATAIAILVIVVALTLTIHVSLRQIKNDESAYYNKDEGSSSKIDATTKRSGNSDNPFATRDSSTVGHWEPQTSDHGFNQLDLLRISEESLIDESGTALDARAINQIGNLPTDEFWEFMRSLSLNADNEKLLVRDQYTANLTEVLKKKSKDQLTLIELECGKIICALQIEHKQFNPTNFQDAAWIEAHSKLISEGLPDIRASTSFFNLSGKFPDEALYERKIFSLDSNVVGIANSDIPDHITEFKSLTINADNEVIVEPASL